MKRCRRQCNANEVLHLSFAGAMSNVWKMKTTKYENLDLFTVLHLSARKFLFKRLFEIGNECEGRIYCNLYEYVGMVRVLVARVDALRGYSKCLKCVLMEFKEHLIL